jgi:hypothetical protein
MMKISNAMITRILKIGLKLFWVAGGGDMTVMYNDQYIKVMF